MGRIAILLWTLLAYGAHGAEPTVSTDTGRNKTTEDSTQISREKAIDLQRSSADREAKALESIKARTFSTDYLSQYTSRADTQAAIVFEPIVSAIERGEVDMGNNKVADLFRRCGLYSYPHPAVTALFLERNGGYQNRVKNYGVPGVYVDAPPSMPLHVSVSGQSLYQYHPEMENKPQRFAPPSEAMRCYIGYSYVLSETIKEMASQAIGQKKPNKGESAQSYFVLDSLEQLASRALVSVIADPVVIESIEQRTEQVLDGGCMLPTLAALNSGNFVWSCGGVDVDPSKGLAKRSGTPYFGENTFMGVSAMFAQVDAVALSQGISQSDMKRYSKVKETAKGKSTRLSKRRSQGSGTSASETIGSGSGVSQ